jgi:hypothetical protein
MIVKNSFNSPPPDGISVPLIHKINDFYKAFYNLKKGLNKADRYGICLKTEDAVLLIFELSIEAALSPRNGKHQVLQKLRIKIEIIKRLVRLMVDIRIIENKKYLNLQESLQEISKMATGWQKSLTDKEP